MAGRPCRNSARFRQWLTWHVHNDLTDPNKRWDDFRIDNKLQLRLPELDIQDFRTTVFDPRIQKLTQDRLYSTIEAMISA